MIGTIKKMLLLGDHVCPWWFSFSLDNVFRRILHNPREILGHYIREGMTVMDIGCGPGYFTLPMAALAGEIGRVIAVDVQRKMLDRMLVRARKAGLDGRIVPRMATRHSLDVDEKADFALVFWMAHEAPDKPAFFRQVGGALKPDGRVLLAEPYGHVMRKDFGRILDAAREAGFRVEPGPYVRLSRSAALAARR